MVAIYLESCLHPWIQHLKFRIPYCHRKIQDTKTVGEAATQPAVRMPPLREGRHNRLFSAAIALRWCEEDKSLRQGDGIVIQDGGREGSLKIEFETIDSVT